MGNLLTHTLDESKAQSVENFRVGCYPVRQPDFWWAKGYRLIEVTVSEKAGE
jgi:hypothetical protein